MRQQQRQRHKRGESEKVVVMWLFVLYLCTANYGWGERQPPQLVAIENESVLDIVSVVKYWA